MHSSCWHIIFNAFEEAAHGHAAFRQCEPHLQAIAAFLSVKDLRNLFVMRCCPPNERRFFDSWSINSHFSWKWEYLLQFLNALLPRFDALHRYFDPEVLQSAQALQSSGGREAQSKALSAQIHACAEALRWLALKSVCLTLQAIALVLQRFVGFVEGCRCHEQHLRQRPGEPWSVAKARFDRLSKDCSQKGRRLVELIAGGLQTHLERIRSASSRSLRVHMAGLSAEQRGGLVIFDQGLKSAILATIEQKTAYLRHPPYTLLGALSADLVYGDATTEQARACVRNALLEVDAKLLAGKANELHRVTALLVVGDANAVALELRRFANGDDSTLGDMARYELSAYAGASLISRRVEASHSHIKGHQRKATRATPALVNCRLRAPAIATALNSDAEFFSFCVTQWRAVRTIKRELLAFAFRLADRWRVNLMRAPEFARWLS